MELLALISVASYNRLLIIPIRLDPASTRAMQDEIKLLNEKLDYLKDGNRRLDGLYYERGERIQKLESELDTCQNQNSGNQVLERMIEGNVKI